MPTKIALIGNPNCGKTTMFNDLTGSTQYVGNWPGVTVEKKEGRLRNHKEIIVTDLPGIYSLSPYTLEEVVSRNYLVHDHPNAIMDLVDATNLERNLYLTTQIIELGIPVVLALNMMDILKKTGDKINAEQLGKSLGCTVVETSALKGIGSLEGAEKAIELAGQDLSVSPKKIFSASVEKTLEAIIKTFG
ncbi:MAG TPA: ferrous iron transporter B, partial [Ruminococcaceae bacterium]|nr:ferrous iron transporter B [Oscillospiraceae bacterium]